MADTIAVRDNFVGGTIPTISTGSNVRACDDGSHYLNLYSDLTLLSASRVNNELQLTVAAQPSSPNYNICCRLFQSDATGTAIGVTPEDGLFLRVGMRLGMFSYPTRPVPRVVTGFFNSTYQGHPTGNMPGLGLGPTTSTTGLLAGQVYDINANMAQAYLPGIYTWTGDNPGDRTFDLMVVWRKNVETANVFDMEVWVRSLWTANQYTNNWTPIYRQRMTLPSTIYPCLTLAASGLVTSAQAIGIREFVVGVADGASLYDPGVVSPRKIVAVCDPDPTNIASSNNNLLAPTNTFPRSILGAGASIAADGTPRVLFLDATDEVMRSSVKMCTANDANGAKWTERTLMSYDDDTLAGYDALQIQYTGENATASAAITTASNGVRTLTLVDSESHAIVLGDGTDFGTGPGATAPKSMAALATAIAAVSGWSATQLADPWTSTVETLATGYWLSDCTVADAKTAAATLRIVRPPWNACWHIDRATGRGILLANRWISWSTIKTATVFKTTSDGGTTWTDEVRLTAISPTYAPSPMEIILTQSGKWFVGFTTPGTGSHVPLLYVDNSGALPTSADDWTYDAATGPLDGGIAYSEIRPVELPDGTLVLYGRTDTWATFSYSTDDGATWSTAVMLDGTNGRPAVMAGYHSIAAFVVNGSLYLINHAVAGYYKFSMHLWKSTTKPTGATIAATQFLPHPRSPLIPIGSDSNIVNTNAYPFCDVFGSALLVGYAGRTIGKAIYDPTFFDPDGAAEAGAGCVPLFVTIGF